jgi:hypothetical protein
MKILIIYSKKFDKNPYIYENNIKIAQNDKIRLGTAGSVRDGWGRLGMVGDG